MGDLFHDDVPIGFITNVLLTVQLAQQHTFLILTKRPERMRKVMSAIFTVNVPLPNIWLGVTAENQEQADKRIPILLQTPAVVRFVSVEPMLGPIKFGSYTLTSRPCFVCKSEDRLGEKRGTQSHPINCGWRRDAGYLDSRGIDWVICGGESGPGARPMHPNWAQSLRDQCQAAGVPFMFKQWGEWAPVEGSGACEPTPICFWDGESDDWKAGLATHTQNMVKVGKKAAGRLLDGVLHDQYPEVPQC